MLCWIVEDGGEASGALKRGKEKCGARRLLERNDNGIGDP